MTEIATFTFLDALFLLLPIQASPADIPWILELWIYWILELFAEVQRTRIQDGILLLACSTIPPVAPPSFYCWCCLSSQGIIVAADLADMDKTIWVLTKSLAEQLAQLQSNLSWLGLKLYDECKNINFVLQGRSSWAPNGDCGFHWRKSKTCLRQLVLYTH